MRTAFRPLRRDPRHSGVIIAIIALGLGVNLPVFETVRDVVLQPLPYDRPHEIVALFDGRLVANRDLVTVREEARSFESVESYSPGWSAVLQGVGPATYITGARISPGLFAMLGVEPQLGRLFRAEEEIPGRERVAVLSHAAWTTRFGGDPSILDRTIRLDGAPYAVIGVLPQRFTFLDESTEIWYPMTMDRADGFAADWLQLFGRLRTDVPVDAASVDLAQTVQTLRERFGYGDTWGNGVLVEPLLDHLVGDVRRVVWLLYASVTLVLLIAIANAAGLTSARMLERDLEMGIRSSLGASERHMAGLLVGEQVGMSIIAGLVSLPLAYVGLPALLRLLPIDLPRASEVGLDAGSLATVLVITIAVGTITGLTASIWAIRRSRRSGSRGGLSVARGVRAPLRGSLLTAQVAFATLLVTGTLLMGRTIWSLSQIDPGYRADDVVSVIAQPPIGPDAPGAPSDDALRSFYRTLTDHLEQRPEVLSAGLARHLPMSGSWWSTEIVPADRTPDPTATPVRAAWNPISENYLEIMGIPLVQGRPFDVNDRADAERVALVSEALADRLWPGESAIGRRVRYGVQRSEGWLTVVGVVGDVRNRALDRDGDAGLYVPFDQHPLGSMAVVLEGSVHPDQVASIATDAVAQFDEAVPIFAVRSAREMVSESFRVQQATLILLLVFAVLGLSLGGIGVYGMVSRRVRAERREIGIRMALGAPGFEIGRRVVTRTVGLTLGGIGIGLVVAALAADVVRGVVFGIAPRDPLSFLLVPVVLLGTAFVASYLPVRRAMRIDPASTLRTE